jgi:hypothetical protein
MDMLEMVSSLDRKEVKDSIGGIKLVTITITYKI